MAYPRLQSMSNYFIPNGTGVLAADNIAASAAAHGEIICNQRCQVRRLAFHVTLAVIATSTAPVVTFRKRSAVGVSADQETLGTLTIPDGTPAGAILYKEIEPVTVEAGEVILFDHTTQAAGGSVAGTGFYDVAAMDSPETAANEANMIASV